MWTQSLNDCRITSPSQNKSQFLSLSNNQSHALMWIDWIFDLKWYWNTTTTFTTNHFILSNKNRFHSICIYIYLKSIRCLKCYVLLISMARTIPLFPEHTHTHTNKLSNKNAGFENHLKIIISNQNKVY